MQKSHFAPLDGLRGVAILLVILVHSYHYTGSAPSGRAVQAVARAGWTGVTLFFVLSGFLITGILLDTRERPRYLRDFFARRSLRIAPLYFVFLAVYLGLIPLVPALAARLARPDSATIICLLTYTGNIAEALTGRPLWLTPLGPLWSLAVEEQVYLGWPFLILLIPSRRLAAVLVFLMGASFAWRFGTRLAGASIELTYSWAPANVGAFAAGGLVARLLRTRPTLVARWAPRVAVAAGTALLVLAARLGHFNFWWAPVVILTLGVSLAVATAAGLIGVSATAPVDALINRLLAAGWLRSLGKYSYAMYLFHTPILELMEPVVSSGRTGFERHESAAGEGLFTLAVLGVSYGAAWVSWHLWEERFLRLKRYFPLSGGVPRPESDQSTTAPAPSR